MRILFVSRCLPLPRHLGDRLILFHLLRGLRARGHRCEVLALSGPKDDETNRRESAALADHLEAFDERLRSLPTYVARLRSPFPARAAAAWQPAMWEAVSRRLAAGGIDVVHFLGGIQVYELRDAARGRPRLIQPYESYSLWLTRAIAAARSPLARAPLRLRRLAARAFERRIFVGFDRVLLNAAPDERCLRELAPGLPTAVIPQGVDPPAEVAPIDRHERAAMVFVGNFSYAPNRDAALRLVDEILPRVRARVPQAMLTLVGADPPPWLCRRRGDGVEVTGTVSDVFPWLSRARVFVSPLAWGAGMKNKTLEAMACGTPVVATPLSCDGIDLADGEHVLLARTSDEMAEAVVHLLTDDFLAARLARAARDLVLRRYGWPLVIERYETLYAELAAAGTGTPRR